MILGMSIAAFTWLHVIISLIGIVAGIPVVYGLLSSKKLPGWTALFFATTILTSMTGFFFPVDGVKPSHVVGVISLVDLAVALLALYVYGLVGAWRWIYVVTALVGFYLNSFVLVAQSFLKVPFLNALAPTGTELPFASSQAALLALFVWLGVLAVKRFHKTPLMPSARHSA
jgi:hypothetical protein